MTIGQQFGVAHPTESQLGLQVAALSNQEVEGLILRLHEIEASFRSPLQSQRSVLLHRYRAG